MKQQRQAEFWLRLVIALGIVATIGTNYVILWRYSSVYNDSPLAAAMVTTSTKTASSLHSRVRDGIAAADNEGSDKIPQSPPPQSQQQQQQHHKYSPKSTFEERLEAALPKNRTYVTVDEIAQAERLVFDHFYIPVPITLAYEAATDQEELPLNYRYPMSIAQQCGTNCRVVPRTKAQLLRAAAGRDDDHHNDHDTMIRIDAILNGHNYATRPSNSKIPTICGCGEARHGTGRSCFAQMEHCTYDSSFERPTAAQPHPNNNKQALWTSWIRLQFPPQHRQVTSITRFVQEMLQPWPHAYVRNDTQPAPLVALHSNCQGSSGRGVLLNGLRQLDSKSENDLPLFDSYGQCWKNRNIRDYEPPTRETWHWHDSEGNRDTTKTDVLARYKVTAALENTLDTDYVTEKRFQALVAGSTPLVYRRSDPRGDYLPHDDHAVIFAEDFVSDTTSPNPLLPVPQQLADYLRQLAANDTLYYTKHQAWKAEGRVKREFVKILFHAANFLPCRACELLAIRKEEEEL